MTRRESIDIIPCGPIVGSIRPPGSKSLTNRALVCAALASGESHLDGVLDSEDTRVMIDSLGRLGISVAHDPLARTAIVRGCSGSIPATSADLHVANSGTTIRFLAAMVALGHGRFVLDGVERMRQRPIGDLIEALRQLSVSAEALSPGGCPPVRIEADGLPGGATEVAGSVSSQFLSGLLLAAPYASGPLTIRVVGSLVSRPYIEMTLAVMRRFGAEVAVAPSGDSFVVSNTRHYVGRSESIEPDASAASYFWGAAAITGGRVTVEGLGPSALQGDVRFVDVLERMGCTVERHDDRITVVGGKLTGIDVDMNAISDTVQTLAAVALFADGPTRVRGVAHNRHKETDRIGDLATELRRLGAEVEEHEDGLTIMPRPLRGAALRTYGDHRMAMSLALVGLRVADVTILDPECTSKTYPEYFDDLERLTGSARA
ncbi:MAG TPA: 3-phosphoshikimate 1-carboxyvinyltransferase [Planctomycetaceae bacterium]|nr:3-phosphoshikimate 1-carboxyvinyltransferase [Planctomycetaceae bacterium]HRF01372.1 3-phosphoshikimate 1-carboxyvinyltransferase [Pirellulaceae bacterium]